jgi:hypothetical protein
MTRIVHDLLPGNCRKPLMVTPRKPQRLARGTLMPRAAI